MKRGLKILIIADAWATLALGMLGPIYAIFVEEIGGDILDASWAYFAFTFSSGTVLYLLGKVEDRWRKREHFIVLGYCLTALGCLLYFFVDSQFSLILTQIVLGFGAAVLAPAFDSLYSDYLDKKREASEWADWEAMGLVVTAVASLMGGYIAHTFGFRILFVWMFGAALLAAFTSFAMLKGESFLGKK